MKPYDPDDPRTLMAAGWASYRTRVLKHMEDGPRLDLLRDTFYLGALYLFRNTTRLILDKKGPEVLECANKELDDFEAEIRERRK